MSVGTVGWRIRWGGTVLAVLGLQASSVSAAIADAPCEIRVSGDTAQRWASQVAELARDMQARGWGSACSELSLEVRDERALLTFVTRDGRSAKRQLSEPRELVATAQALSVAPAAPEPEPEAPTTAPAAPERVWVATADSAPVVRVTASPAVSPRPLFGTQACVRSGANWLLTPCLNLTAALPFGTWELGLLGRYEMHYFNLRPSHGAPDASAIALGAFVGRHGAWGSLSLRTGVAGLLAGLRNGNGNDDSDEAESRLAAFGGFTWPARGHVALRADAMLEWVALSGSHSRRNTAGNYSMPWWAVTSSLGVELR